VSSLTFLSVFEGCTSSSAFRLLEVAFSCAFFFLLTAEVKSLITGADVDDVVAEEWALNSLSSASAAMAGALWASDSFGAVFNSSTYDRA
jgi:hypothetical protein